MIKDELPVFRDTYKLVSMIIEMVPSFPRIYRYTLGEKLLEVSLGLFEYIYLANLPEFKENRQKYLTGFQIKFDLLKVLIRLCTDSKAITITKSSNLAILTTSIGKQITGWKKSANKGQNP